MGSRAKEDQERVRLLLTDTVTLLCKNGLTFDKNMKIQGLLGITLDDSDVFIVHINDQFQSPVAQIEIAEQIHVDSPLKRPRPSDSSTPAKRRRRSGEKNSSKERRHDHIELDTIDLDPEIEIKSEPSDCKSDVDKDLTDLLKDGHGELKLDNTVPAATLSTSLPIFSGTVAIPQPDLANVTFPSAASRDGHPSTSETYDHQPYVTGMIRNAAENSHPGIHPAGLSWNSSAAAGANSATLPSWNPGPSQSVLDAPSVSSQSHLHGSQSSNSTGMGVIDRPSSDHSSCLSCAQVKRKQNFYRKKGRLKRLGVPGHMLPMFNEKTIKSDPSCMRCQKRLLKYSRYNLGTRKTKSSLFLAKIP